MLSFSPSKQGVIAPSFKASKGKVHLAGAALSDERVEDLLTFFRAREAEAETAAREARKAFNELWEERCEAMDQRQERRVA